MSFVSPSPTSLRHALSLRVECHLCCVDSKGCCSCSGRATIFGPPDFFCLYFTTEYQMPPNELITRPVTFRAWNLTPPSTKKPNTWTSTDDEMERRRGRGRGRVTDVKEWKSGTLQHNGMHGDAAAVSANTVLWSHQRLMINPMIWPLKFVCATLTSRHTSIAMITQIPVSFIRSQVTKGPHDKAP